MRSRREHIEHARKRRREPTVAEHVLWRELRHRQLGVRFRREDPIGPFTVDFSCRTRRLVIETDGITHEDATDDEQRDRWLTRHGWQVLRFTDHDVMHNLDSVMDTIWHTIHTQRPTT